MQIKFQSVRRVLTCSLLFSIAAFAGCGSSNDTENVAQAELDVPVTAQKATAGVGKQGQKLKDEPDIIAGPVKVLFKFKQQAVLDIQIPQALQLFQASEGRMPKSHDEFMQKIVEANRLQLPELPDGAVYRFNTEKGELWVYPADESPAE